jgi:hypothetical protein
LRRELREWILVFVRWKQYGKVHKPS